MWLQELLGVSSRNHRIAFIYRGHFSPSADLAACQFLKTDTMIPIKEKNLYTLRGIIPFLFLAQQPPGAKLLAAFGLDIPSFEKSLD